MYNQGTEKKNFEWKSHEKRAPLSHKSIQIYTNSKHCETNALRVLDVCAHLTHKNKRIFIPFFLHKPAIRPYVE